MMKKTDIRVTAFLISLVLIVLSLSSFRLGHPNDAWIFLGLTALVIILSESAIKLS